MNGQALRGFFFLLIAGIAALSFLSLVDFFGDLREERQGTRVEADLRKLDIISLGLLRHSGRLGPSEVRRLAAGKVPAVDPWGTEYKMLGTGESASWASAGRDGVWNTRDDIALPLAKVAAAVPDRDFAAEIRAIEQGGIERAE